MESCGVWPAKWHGSSCFAEGRVAECCSTSAIPATGGRSTAASAAGGKRGGNNGGPPTGGTSKAGRTARSPGLATGLPEKVPPPARDGSYFRPPPPIRQHQKTMDETAKKAALWGGISASAAIEAVSSRHPARLHCVWAHAGVIGPERGAVIDERNGSTARRCSRSKPRMNFGRRRRQVNRWNSRMNSLHPKEAHFDVWAKEEG